MAAEDRIGLWGFPAFRKLVGGAHYYRIDGPRDFVEVQRVGSRLVRHAVNQAPYPEQLRIAEMLSCTDGRFEPLDEDAWAELWTASATFTTGQAPAGNPGGPEPVE
ncbi:MAG: hypothetical protein IPK70_11065 [Flavobacteriales bacterium]|jgi:hypothetical protein|nr:hypothetical protein [Flavobacteriales bacterium]